MKYRKHSILYMSTDMIRQFREPGGQYRPEEDDGALQDSGKVERCVGVALRRGTLTKVAHNTKVLLEHLERIRSTCSCQPVSYTHLTLPTNREV